MENAEKMVSLYKVSGNGRIIQNIEVRSDTAVQLMINDPDLVEGSPDRETQYIKDGEITLRPTQLTTLTGMTLNNLPTPCQIIIDGISYDGVDSPTVELEFDETGTHNIKVVAFPYLDKEFTIET